MVTHMKTTIDIANTLFEQTKKAARHNKMSFKQVVESSLRLFLNTQTKVEKPYKLPDCSVAGHGLVDGLSYDDWPEIRKRIYEGRGG